jgi:hypothetical protein
MNMMIHNFHPNPFKFQFFASIQCSLSADLIEKMKKLMDLQWFSHFFPAWPPMGAMRACPCPPVTMPPPI